jgi:Flp pilus assembly protein TadG
MDTIKLTIIGNKKGFAIVWIALCILVLIGIVGLVVDLGHLYLVRGELQNAADASALAGAGSLYKDPLNPTATPALDFTRAQAAATGFISKNKSDGSPLSVGDVLTGYWDSTSKTIVATQTTPPLPGAVRVTINRSGGNNGGAVPVLFARVLPGGSSTAPVTATSTAVSGYVGAVPGGRLFPMALSSCMTNQYFSQDPLPDPPTTIVLDSVYTPGGSNCYTGQWTSFKLDANDVPTIHDLMYNGNPDPIQTGDDIWIEPGAKAQLYGETQSSFSGQDVLMAIIDGSVGINTRAEMQVVGFATFHIDSASQPQKTVTGHFISFFKDYPGTTPGGSVSNTVAPPVMVQ